MAAQIEETCDVRVHADESLRLKQHIDDLTILVDRSPQADRPDLLLDATVRAAQNECTRYGRERH